MKAIVITEYGGPSKLKIAEIPIPKPKVSDVLVRVKAFGVNRAETYMRKGAWGSVAKISGIECVGEVCIDPSGTLKSGQKVAALMGGMGRTINGSYAEYTCLPATNVLPLETDLDWAELAALPESYATAWSCLYRNMKLQPGQIILIRGGTSALGQAAINIASRVPGVQVIASTRRPERIEQLKTLGAAEVLVEEPALSEWVRFSKPAGLDGVMDIIGNTTLLDSARMLRRDGYLCNAGFLGGGEPLYFNPLTDLPPGIHLNFFASFMFGTREFPLSDIPLQQIVDDVARGDYSAKPAKIFDFYDVVAAHELMESNAALGKIVVLL